MQRATDASFLRRLAQVIYPLCTAADNKKFTDDLSTASNGCTKNTTYDWAGIDDPTQPQRAELCACNVSAITVPKCMWTKYSKEEKQPFNVTTVEHFTFVYNCFTISGKSLPSVTVEGAAAAETPVPTNATTTAPTNYCTDQQISAFTSALNTASNGCMGGTSYDWGGDENPVETQYKEICKCTSVSTFTIPDCSVKKGDDINTLTTHYEWVTDKQCKKYPVEKSSNVGLIAGIAGGVVVIVLLIVGFILCKRRRKSKQQQGQHELYQDTNAALSPVGYHPIGVTPRTTGPKKYTDSRPSDGGRTTISTTNGSVRPSGSGSMGLKDGRRMTETATWDDPVITAVRIPLDAISFDTLISRGGYGEVYRGSYRGETVAIKQLLPARRKDLTQINDFLGEVKLMSSLDHERVVKFIGVAWNSLSDACMVIEYMENGDLRSVLTRWDEGKEKRKNGFDDDKVKIALHIAHALVYLHSLQSVVLHRDFKSKNILLDANMDAKLTDFGISRERADVTMTAGVGSSLWMAPEVMMGNRYDEKADIFSFGVVLSELDTHQLPYFHARVSEFGQNVPDTAILQQVMLGRISVAFSDRADPELVDLGRECVRLNPDERPTTAMVLHRVHQVAHGWHRGMAF